VKKHLLASVGLMALTAAGSASAANIDLPPPPVAIWSWSGLYLGGHGGYGWGRDPFSDPIFGSKAPLALAGINSTGPVWGFQAGANWQAGAWVGGLEIDLSGTNIKGSSSVSASISEGGATAAISATRTDKFDLLGSARGRLGFLAWPSVLLYGTGGPAWTRFVQTTDEAFFLSMPGGTPATVVVAASISRPSWRFGAVAGVGAEARLWDSNWLARVEYLHYDFGDSGSSSSTGSASQTSGRLTTDVIRAGLSYKFGLDRVMAGSAGAKMAMPVKAPRAVAAWSWSGFYLGGHAGYGWGRDPFSRSFTDFSETIVLTGVDSNGFVGGFQAGANWQSGAWVGGLEVDLSGTSVKGSTSRTVPIATPGVTGTDTEKQTDSFDMLGSARARLGYLAWPSTLLYGTGGLAWTRFIQTVDATEVITAGGTSSASSSSTPSWRFGWVAGVGAETRLWDTNWLARIEYLHYDFGDSGSSFDTGCPSCNRTSGHLTNDVVRAGLSYKLDWSGAVTVPARIAMPLKARPAVRAAWNWGGYYLGGHAGYGWGRDPMSDAIFGGKALTSGPLSTGIDSNGLLAGFQAGANWQIGTWVSGLEIDLSATGIKGSATNVAPDGSSIETRTDRFDMLGSARGRLGYLLWPNALLYGTGGLAWTRLEQSRTDLDATSTFGGSTPIWEFGWVAGVGGEVRLWDSNWLLRVEYLHYDFGDSGHVSASVFVPGDPSLSGSLISTSGHLTTDVVRTGLSFKFD
jgi:opacity protein-like surface antigen